MIKLILRKNKSMISYDASNEAYLFKYLLENDHKCDACRNICNVNTPFNWYLHFIHLNELCKKLYDKSLLTSTTDPYESVQIYGSKYKYGIKRILTAQYWTTIVSYLSHGSSKSFIMGLLILKSKNLLLNRQSVC